MQTSKSTNSDIQIYTSAKFSMMLNNNIGEVKTLHTEETLKGFYRGLSLLKGQKVYLYQKYEMNFEEVTQ